MALPCPGNAKKIHQGRMILRNLSLYSWPKAIRYNIHPFSRWLHRDNLATVGSFRAVKEASPLNIAPFCSICHHFVPGNTLSSRAYSYGPNAAQLLHRSFPTPALTLVPEIVYSQVSAFGLSFWPICKIFKTCRFLYRSHDNDILATCNARLTLTFDPNPQSWPLTQTPTPKWVWPL